MKMRPRLILGLLLGLSAFGALGAEPSPPPAGDAPRDVHINAHVSDSIDSDGGSLSMTHKTLLVRVKGIEEARVTPDGSLAIGNSPVPVSDEGRRALVAYHDQGRAVVEQGKAMGKEGIRFAFSTMGNVFAGLLTASEEDTDKRVENDAKQFQAMAEALCASLGDLRQTQDAAAAVVPEFTPYAGVVTAKSVEDCHKQAHEDN